MEISTAKSKIKTGYQVLVVLLFLLGAMISYIYIVHVFSDKKTDNRHDNHIEVAEVSVTKNINQGNPPVGILKDIVWVDFTQPDAGNIESFLECYFRTSANTYEIYNFKRYNDGSYDPIVVMFVKDVYLEKGEKPWLEFWSQHETPDHITSDKRIIYADFVKVHISDLNQIR